MVADLYGANITQGPALPMANRTAFIMSLLGNPALLRSRMVAAINTVSHYSALDFILYAVRTILKARRTRPSGTRFADGFQGACAVGLAVHKSAEV